MNADVSLVLANLGCRFGALDVDDAINHLREIADIVPYASIYFPHPDDGGGVGVSGLDGDVLVMADDTVRALCGALGPFTRGGSLEEIVEVLA